VQAIPVKGLFLALLLANLLALAWQLWVAPPEIPPDRLVKANSEAELTLAVVQKAPVAAAPSSTKTAVGIFNSGDQCLRIGPLPDAALADRVSQRLQREGIVVSQSAEQGQIWVGHWVQLENVGNREAADRIVAKLSAGGVPDAYVLPSAGPVAVSLGVFRSRERADKVVTDARRLGLQPVVIDRYRVGFQYWLQAKVPAGAAARLVELTRESGQILRSDAVPCPPGAVGGTGPVN
jgi:hypothetical protein